MATQISDRMQFIVGMIDPVPIDTLSCTHDTGWRTCRISNADHLCRRIGQPTLSSILHMISRSYTD